MAAKKCRKKLRAVGQAAAEGMKKEIGKKCAEGEGRDSRASIRQTRAAAKETADGFDGVSSSLKKKQSRECATRGRVRAVTKDSDDGTEKRGRPENSQTRACTRSEEAVLRCSGAITASAGRTVALEIKENSLPSVTDWHWTERQEKALLESVSTIKPGVHFWSLVADRAPGRSAEDCFKKFYSRHTTTRAATRSRTEGVDSAPAKRSGTKRARSKSPVNVEKRGRERRAIGRAATGPVKQEIKTTRKGRNAAAFTRLTRATSQGAKWRRIERAGNSPEVKQKKAAKPESVHKPKNVKLSQRATKGSKERVGKQDLVEKVQVRASTPGVTLASGFDPSSVSDGDKEIESPSAFGVSVDDDDLWTEAQEAALQDAYSTIRPSANFWHFISKRVPGRSAEECFNKFYAGHPTPPRVAPRSCLKGVDCPPTVPNPPKAKATGGKRLLEAHRTVRNILRRQQVDDEDYEADAFAALEPPDVVHKVMERGKDDESVTFDERDVKSCVHVPLPGSTENSTTQGALADKENWKPKAVGQNRDCRINQSHEYSPEILKKVKNPLMLDKYIDHLHQRRTRRVGTKSAQKNAKKAMGLYDGLSKDGLDFREVRLDAIHRAKQELRDVFLRPGSAVDEPFLDLVDDTTDQDDDESVDSQMLL